MQQYGDEYPRAVTLNGVRMPLTRESDYSRFYRTDDGKYGFVVSRFRDGSASISLAQVEAGWPSWSDDKRRDFCGSCHALGGQDDFPSILRFVMSQGDAISVSQVALSVARWLPREEAFTLLCDALEKADGEETANITQAIAHTKHPDAQEMLLEHLFRLWAASDLWDDDPFSNSRAFDATCCIAHLLELGAAPQDFDDKVRRLAAHPCEGNRDSCSTFLRRHYDWLPSREVRPLEI